MAVVPVPALTLVVPALVVAPAVATPVAAPSSPWVPPAPLVLLWSAQRVQRERDVGPALGVHLDVHSGGVDGAVHVDADLQPPPVVPLVGGRVGGCGPGGAREHRAHHGDPGERPGRPQPHRPDAAARRRGG
ncbi:hypothetical protein [Kitasatospora sp. CB02891]|uniref:hypothetical protein n=1 Tax=Kitasatospora sp. CB02891 TaxID=2020329 RepID=UPI0018E1DC03|nr:hypothetical protein [Kitasatospora sp. CB02891]